MVLKWQNWLLRRRPKIFGPSQCQPRLKISPRPLLKKHTKREIPCRVIQKLVMTFYLLCQDREKHCNAVSVLTNFKHWTESSLFLPDKYSNCLCSLVALVCSYQTIPNRLLSLNLKHNNNVLLPERFWQLSSYWWGKSIMVRSIHEK